MTLTVAIAQPLLWETLTPPPPYTLPPPPHPVPTGEEALSLIKEAVATK